MQTSYRAEGLDIEWTVDISLSSSFPPLIIRTMPLQSRSWSAYILLIPTRQKEEGRIWKVKPSNQHLSRYVTGGERKGNQSSSSIHREIRPGRWSTYKFNKLETLSQNLAHLHSTINLLLFIIITYQQPSVVDLQKSSGSTR